jgi:hypothetical protein
MKKISAFVFSAVLGAAGCAHLDHHASTTTVRESAGADINRSHDNGTVGVHTSTETEKAYNRDNERPVDSSDKH